MIFCFDTDGPFSCYWWSCPLGGPLYIDLLTYKQGFSKHKFVVPSILFNCLENIFLVLVVLLYFQVFPVLWIWTLGATYQWLVTVFGISCFVFDKKTVGALFLFCFEYFVVLLFGKNLCGCDEEKILIQRWL